MISTLFIEFYLQFLQFVLSILHSLKYMLMEMMIMIMCIAMKNQVHKKWKIIGVLRIAGAVITKQQNYFNKYDRKKSDKKQKEWVKFRVKKAFLKVGFFYSGKIVIHAWLIAALVKTLEKNNCT